MKKKNQKHARRVRRLALLCTVCTILLAVSTYAWFVGMQTVSVSPFDVEIAAIDGLSLSLSGADGTFTDTVTINSTNYSTTYAGNTNTWGGTGLIPISSVGKIDTTASRLVMYQKGSLTTTPGGYRLMASRVDNYTPIKDGDGTVTGYNQENGYVAFDLFVKNLSGDEYYTTMNELNEEAIYLTLGSEVTVADGGAENTGIENSVRVAFAQIGRVKATTKDASLIQKISCAGGSGVTSICSRDAQIWEPNDTKHEQNAINWYKESCKARTKAGILEGSYSGDCGTVEDGESYDTYAVSSVIDYTDEVDVYDGTDYNGYTGSVTAGKLTAYPYFTDTMKEQKGTARPTFITLAPNSITKIRVYIYIEGQDVDNYDFASLGKKISVKFGFTKERFYGDDVDYNENDNADDNNGPALPSDVVRPASS